MKYIILSMFLLSACGKEVVVQVPQTSPTIAQTQPIQMAPVPIVQAEEPKPAPIYCIGKDQYGFPCRY